MSYLWCGGEDIDFPNGLGVITNTNIRSTYSRVGIASATASSSGCSRSNPFPGGSITSGWLHFWWGVTNNSQSSVRAAGLVYSGGSLNGSGLWIGVSSNSARAALFKYDGTTLTALVAGTTDIFTSNTFVAYQWDVQVINYGASATVNVYCNGNIYMTYTGDVTVSGVTSLDCVAIYGHTTNAYGLSELIVATTDTRSVQGLVTLAPNGNGTTQSWSNPAFTNFNPTTINDANSTFSNTTGQDEQATLIDLPSGNFSIPLVKIAARALATTGATATGVKLGVNNGGTVAVGSAHTLSTAFNTVEDYLTNDPTTGSAWAQSAMNGLQLNLRSA